MLQEQRAPCLPWFLLKAQPVHHLRFQSSFNEICVVRNGHQEHILYLTGSSSGCVNQDEDLDSGVSPGV